MLSIRSLLVGNRNLVRDLIGIVLALALGFGGQRFLSNPVSVLAPKLPVLSTQDWPGSQFSVEPQIIEAGAWSENRAFRQSLILIRNEIAIAEVTQTILWYADRMQAAAAWDQHRNDPYYDFPVVVSNTGNNGPESVLICTPPEPYILILCSYRAYWKHWYTNVEFHSRTDEDLPFSEIEKLNERIDQLLMSAPDRPCQWFSCTGTGEEVKP